MKKIRITAVSYLNTKPLLYGILQSKIAGQIDLQLDIPSVCARKLKSGEADLGLVPVAVFPELSSPQIISDYCIGCVGPVKTVGIFAHAPLENLTHLYLDYHSKTSVELVKLLLRDHWKVDPVLLHAEPGFESQITGSTGALIIGDRTIGLHEKFPFFYDLGSAWMDHTGLPFVFAAWVSNRPMDEGFTASFNRALQRGIEHIPQLIYLLPTSHANFDLQEYFTRFISYELDPLKKEALSTFLAAIGTRLQPSLVQSLGNH